MIPLVRSKILLTLSFAILADTAVQANNGTQFTGYGVKAQGMGGASVALPQDTTAAANNPAGMAFVGDRFDLEVQTIVASTDLDLGPVRHSGTSVIPVPFLGYNRRVSDRWTVGVSTSPSGAAFSYSDNITPGATSGKTSGLFLNELVLPTVTYLATPRLAIGVSAALGVQVLKLNNLPGVAERGLKTAFGTGYRVGVQWNPIDAVSVGASYASKVHMGKLNGYDEDVFAGVGGQVDVPEKIAAGVAVRPTSRVTLAADYMHVNWENTQFRPLFGYRNQDVFRGGVSLDVDPRWTLRAGGSVARRAITGDVVLPNALLVGINSRAVTGGVTRKFTNGGELSLAVEASLGNRLRGTGPSTGVNMDVTFLVFGLAYGKSF